MGPNDYSEYYNVSQSQSYPNCQQHPQRTSSNQYADYQQHHGRPTYASTPQYQQPQQKAQQAYDHSQYTQDYSAAAALGNLANYGSSAATGLTTAASLPSPHLPNGAASNSGDAYSAAPTNAYSTAQSTAYYDPATSAAQDQRIPQSFTQYEQQTSSHSRPSSVNSRRQVDSPTMEEQRRRAAALSAAVSASRIAQPQRMQQHHSMHQTSVRPHSPAQAQQHASPRQTVNHHTTPTSSSSTSHGHSSDRSHRMLPTVLEPLQHGVSSTPSGYQYNGNTNLTVDPSQVYNPWPEMQRKEAERVHREEEARRLEEDAKRKRKAEEAERKAAEKRRREQERIRMEEEARQQAQRRAQEERKTQEAEARRNAARTKEAATATTTTTAPAAAQYQAPAASTVPSTSVPKSTDADLEGEIRALMLKMREYNKKDPALLAKIWTQERDEHTRSQATVRASETSAQPQQTQPSPKPTPVQLQQNVPTVSPRNAPNQAARRTQPHQSSNGEGFLQPPKPSPNTTAQSVIPASQPSAENQSARPPATAVPVKKGSATLWPADKKNDLAAAAADWLNCIPKNSQRRVHLEEISRILDSHPSYIELCEKLEGKGIELERASFAKALLTAVPDINSSGKPGQGPKPTPRPIGTQPPSLPPTRPQVNPDLNGTGPSLVGPIQIVDYDTGHHPSVHSATENCTPTPGTSQTSPAASQGGQRSVSIATPTAEDQLRKPLSKSDAARKRNFSDIVDLTLLSDDEQPPPKKLMTKDRDSPRPSTSRFGGKLPTQAPAREPSSALHGIDSDLAQLLRPVALENLKFAPDLVQPIDRSKVKRRSHYDTRTICRDVLLAAGRHPHMRPLNAHLEPLRTHFKQVDSSSDLSTFRWDLVDPDPPDKMQLDLPDPEANDEDADDESEEDHKPRTRVQQAVITGGAAIAVEIGVPASSRSKGGPLSKPKPPRASDPRIRSRPYGSVDERSEPAPDRPQHGETNTERHGRGRPTGTGRTTQTAAAPPVPTSSPAAFQRAEAPNSAPSRSTGYAAFRQQLSSDGTKKKGRPVGWRKAIHGSAAVRARLSSEHPPNGTASPSPSGLRNARTGSAPRGRGRPPTSAPTSATAAPPRPPEPNYAVYKCEWKNCAGQLHNLDVLRKHVRKIHGLGQRGAVGSAVTITGRYQCWWATCGSLQEVRDLTTGELEEKFKRHEFRNMNDWEAHIELRHFRPLAWKLGDGPKGGLSDANDSEAAESYLSDSTGRQVTPHVSLPHSPTSVAVPRVPSAQQQQQYRGPGRPPKISDEERARQALKDLERKKRAVGFGIDRSGATLANDKRRMGFIDDDDEELVVTDG